MHEAAAGNPHVYVQLKAGHSQGSITERYIHAAQVLFPARLSGARRGFGALGAKDGNKEDGPASATGPSERL